MTPRARDTLLRWLVPAIVCALSLTAVAAEVASAGVRMPAAVGAYAAAVATAAFLLGVRRRPVAVSAAVLVVCLAYHLVGFPGQGPAFALFIAVAVVGHRGRVTRALPLGIGVAVAWAVIPVLPPRGAPWTDAAVLGPALAMCIVAIVSAALSASFRQTRAEHAAETAQLRAGIARDIHDVLAHTISAITVQSNLALDAIDDDPVLAAASMRRVRDLARAATPQLRHSLLRLRADGRPEHPQPTLALLDEVLDDARAAGFSVQRRVELGSRMIDPVAELTIARIGQEAVTNAVRHSGGRRLRCTVEARGDEIVLEVEDDGARPSGPDGLGIAGMRERAAAVGGRVELGPVDGGGFRVRAHIPATTSGPS